MTFGSSAVDATPAELLAAEATHSKTQLQPVDELLHDLIRVAFGTAALVEGGAARDGSEFVQIEGLSEGSVAFMDQKFSLERQEARGAWFLPQEVTLKFGCCNLPYLVNSGAKFASAAAREQVARVDMRAGTHGLTVWSLAVPLFGDLMAPIELRTSTSKLAPVEQQVGVWEATAALFMSLGLHLEDQLDVLRYGGGWAALRIHEQLLAKRAFIAALADQVSLETVRLWRARATLELVDGYYRKSRRGAPLSRKVLTKPLQARLAGLFGGDWLEFLAYVGEQPNDADEIVTALPEPRLYIGDQAKSAEIADQYGVAADEVERMLAAYLGARPGRSPIQARVDAATRLWSEFDELHARQQSGMRSLSGLVDEGFISIGNDRAPTPYAYRELLSPDLTDEVDVLWDGIVLQRWPERIVSEFHPHRQMAEAFGPALMFWHDVALTCWFICEGPYARTTVEGLRPQQHRRLVELEEIGSPIDPLLFRDLEHAEKLLGPVEQVIRDQTTTKYDGFSITMTMSSGSRRSGFEHLRDVVTKHRRRWAEQHLDDYLRARWDGELRAVATEFNRRTAARGKAPTFKQFASFASGVANHWFCGDLAALYSALGERPPATPERIDLLVGDPYAFVLAVHDALGGGPTPEPEASWRDPERYRRHWDIGKLAEGALQFLQLSEALGRAPTPKEFTAQKYNWELLGGEEEGWARYTAVIDELRTRRLRYPSSAMPSPALSAAAEEKSSDDGQLIDAQSDALDGPQGPTPLAKQGGRWLRRLRRRSD